MDVAPLGEAPPAAAAEDGEEDGAAIAVAGLTEGALTVDDELRFLTSVDGDQAEAMRRLQACLVRSMPPSRCTHMRSTALSLARVLHAAAP